MNHKRKIQVAAFVVLLSFSCSAAAQQRTSPVEVGSHAPLLKFTDRGGRSHDIDWKGDERADIFFFFDARTQASLLGLSLLESLNRKIGPDGVRIFAIESSGHDEEGYAKAMERYHRLYGEPSFPVVLDPEFTLSALFGIPGVPSNYLLQRHGVCLYHSPVFDEFGAVGLAMRLERLLGHEEGFLSSSLQEIGIDSNTEKAIRAETAGGPRRKVATGLLKVGDKVPPFSYTDLEGRTRQFSWGGEKGLSILFFWGALCLPCIQEMEYLDSIYRASEGYNLSIAAVEATGLSREGAAAAMRRLDRFQARPAYAIVPDEEGRIGDIFGVSGRLPQTFFISEGGVIVYHAEEFIREGAGGLARKIERALGAEAGTLKGDEEREGDMPPSLLESISDDGDRESVFRSNLTQGDSYYNAWEFDKALPHYLRCLEIQPGNSYLRKRVAEIYERRGNFPEAIAEWQKVLAVEPDDEEARGRIEELGKMHDRSGRKPSPAP